MMFNSNNKFFYVLALVATTATALTPTNTCPVGTDEVYCASAEACINPTTTQCDFGGSATFTSANGEVELKCRDGQCNLNSGCQVDQGSEAMTGMYMSDLNGVYYLKEGLCTDVVCSGCSAETDANTSSNGAHCKQGAGEVYCPEAEACIDPDTTTCSFGGEQIDTSTGEVVLQCKDGRVDLTAGTIKYGSSLQSSFSGKYKANLNGKLMFTSGANGVVTGCVITETGLLGGTRGLRGIN